jgi:hypothetical protein
MSFSQFISESMYYFNLNSFYKVVKSGVNHSERSTLCVHIQGTELASRHPYIGLAVEDNGRQPPSAMIWRWFFIIGRLKGQIISRF